MLMPQLRNFICDAPLRTTQLISLCRTPLLAEADIFLGQETTLPASLRLLCSVPHLTQLRLELYANLTFTSLNGFSPSFPSLEGLEINVDAPDQWEAIFDLLQKCHCPRLQTFCLSTDIHPDDVDAELKCAFSGFINKQTSIVKLDLDAAEDVSRALLGWADLKLPNVINIYFYPFESIIPILMLGTTQTIIVEGISFDESDHNFLDALCRPSSLCELRFMHFAWRDGRNSKSVALLAGTLMSHAIKLEPFGVKLLDRDGVTFRNAASF